MKRLLAFVFLISVFAFRVSNPCLQRAAQHVGRQAAAMTFDSVKHNFGMIHQGDIVSHEFTFTNTGDEPLIITEAEVSCECTKVDFPKQPIQTGQTGIVKVTFDSKSAMDRQERTVIVKSNASNSPVTLTFKAIVLKRKG